MSNPSRITTDLAVDDPLVQDANHRFNSNDRQYIDNQILGVEQHLVDALINGRHASWYDLAGSSVAVIAGDNVCLSSTAGSVTKSVAAALALAGANLGTVIQAAAPGGKVLVATGGILPPSITGLSTSIGAVKVNTTTSRCEYVATPVAADYIIGFVNNVGWMVVSRNGSLAASLVPAVPRLTALDANHLHAWELTETSGSSFVDTGSSASKVNLPIVNTANVQLDTPGLLGACPMFGLTTTPSAAVGSAAELVSAFTDLPTTNITIEAWVRQTSASGATGRQAFSCDFVNSVNLQMYVGTTASDNYSTAFRTSGTFGNGSVGTLTDFAASSKLVGQWVYIAVTYDGSFFRMYVNGELLKKEAATGTISWTNTNGPAPKIALAADTSASVGTNLVGQLSRVRMSNIVRTQTALRAVYSKAMGI